MQVLDPDLPTLYALGLACSSLGRHAAAERPLRAALATADGTLAPPPCELQVSERDASVAASDGSTGSGGSGASTTVSPLHFGTFAASFVPEAAMSSIALCDCTESPRSCSTVSSAAELPVSTRRSSGCNQEVISIAVAKLNADAPHTACTIADASFMGEGGKLGVVTVGALAPQQPRPVAAAGTRARLCHLLGVSLYMQAIGFAQVPCAACAASPAALARAPVFVIDRAPRASQPPKAAFARTRQLQEALRLLARAESLLDSSRWRGVTADASLELSLADVADAQGKCELERGHAQRAVALHKHAKHLREAHVREGDVRLGHSCYHVGVALMAAEHHAVAVPYLEAALDVYGARSGGARLLLAAVLRQLNLALTAARRPLQAKAAFASALARSRSCSSLHAAVVKDGAAFVAGRERVQMLRASLDQRAQRLHRDHPLVQEALRLVLDAMAQEGCAQDAALLQQQFDVGPCGPVLQVG
jgi:hypothetical protein